ncbi:cytosine permease [Komagataeibacter rhaeticus]|nr:cytosine permease [Komagataeibacter rhaeticus]
MPYTVMTRIGVDYGIPGQVAARISFGIRGAQLIPSAARVICSIYFSRSIP